MAPQIKMEKSSLAIRETIATSIAVLSYTIYSYIILQPCMPMQILLQLMLLDLLDSEFDVAAYIKVAMHACMVLYSLVM